jgi:hypothetical protein
MLLPLRIREEAPRAALAPLPAPPRPRRPRLIARLPQLRSGWKRGRSELERGRRVGRGELESGRSGEGQERLSEGEEWGDRRERERREGGGG